ncbi:hypothetical protein [Pedobacter cryoconitis]|uniref:Uncharacterized protein n=1 Tax=Pedobacter cryoconitis TaxID=188932 RepID=A0A7X0MN03_9SPHI|nr:hypothetical protein [Pedobacter cryoconitis]MBB6503013.1 hypothetical protein [Pedobacter cryoconitis]
MIQELLQIKPTDSFQDMRDRMGAFLGMNTPIPENAMRRAVQDQDYANNLITCRNAPGFLEVLLTDPENEQYALNTVQDNEISNVELIQKAAGAFMRWGKAGFSVVDDTTLEIRENACMGCENLSKPEKKLQKLVTSKPSEQIGKRISDCVCKLCGCSLSKKIRIPTESCPARHPENSNLNRWGEPALKTG